MFISDPIFKRGVDGKIRQWNYVVEPNTGRWKVLSGIMGGTPTESTWKQAKPKNIGKANQTTAHQQAMLEGNAKREEKLRAEYRANVADIDNVPRGPMLADTYAGNLDFTKGVWCQPKLDGIRALITKDSAITMLPPEPAHDLSPTQCCHRCVVSFWCFLHLDAALRALETTR